MGKKKSKSSTVQNQTQRNIIPAWVEQGSADAVGRARALANRPYQGWEGQRFADLSDQEQQGIDLWDQGSGDYNRFLDRAETEADRASTSWLDADRDAYMNPYIEGALEPALRGTREEMAQSWRDTGAQAAQAGAFGGARSTLMQTEVQNRGMQQLGDIRAQGMAAAYESARQAFDSDRSAAARAVEQFRSLGAQGQQQLATQVEGLMATGGLKRDLEQAGLDFDYGQFAEARDWDVNNLSNLVNTLASVPYSTTQTGTMNSQTTNTSSGGVLGTIVGVGAVVAGVVTGNPALVAGGISAATS